MPIVEVEPVSTKALVKCHRQGWQVAPFRDGDPDQMVVMSPDGAITIQGEPIQPTDTVMAGIYKLFTPRR